MYSLREYFEFARDIYEARGAYGVYRNGKAYLYETFLRQLGPVLDNEPEYVLEREWDVLIILDACRVDLLEEVSDEYEFLPEPPYDTIWSAGSYSEGWLRENFTGTQARTYQEQMKTLAHISGNPFTSELFEGDEFAVLDEVWEYGWDDENGYIPPDVITDRAITYHRENMPQQMLVHYMQPHSPFISDKNTGYHIDTNHFASPTGAVSQRTPWELLRDGNISQEECWEAYKDTLQVGLDSVEVLLNSIDANRVIISADHGNAVGEWGVYGHPRNIPLAPLRQVPWVEVSAENTEEYDPPENPVLDSEQNEFNREEQLRDLGYV